MILLRHKGKIDTDGYLMLLLSVLVLVLTAGISYLFFVKKIILFAKNTKTSCQNGVMLCVLGKRLLNDKPDKEYLLRLERARIILEQDDRSEVVLLGGKTGKATLSEAYAGRAYLLKNNINESRIYLEEESTNTLENFLNANKLLQRKNKMVVVISNRYHLSRAKHLAEGLGVNVEVCAAEEKLNLNLVNLLKIFLEALHVHWYVVGRYYAHITKNSRIIERVG